MPKTAHSSSLMLEATLGTSKVTRLRVEMPKPRTLDPSDTIRPEDCMDVLYAVVSGAIPPRLPSAEIVNFPNGNQRFTA